MIVPCLDMLFSWRSLCPPLMSDFHLHIHVLAADHWSFSCFRMKCLESHTYQMLASFYVLARLKEGSATYNTALFMQPRECLTVLLQGDWHLRLHTINCGVPWTTRNSTDLIKELWGLILVIESAIDPTECPIWLFIVRLLTTKGDLQCFSLLNKWVASMHSHRNFLTYLLMDILVETGSPQFSL